MRLLLVEDTEDVAEAIVASFMHRGDAIDRVDTVEAACDTLAVNDYEVVILDINLPDGEGTEVLRQLRRQRKPTPVLMLTARMAVEDRVAALDIGADDYLVKPFDLRELQARVRALGRRAGPDRSGIIEFGQPGARPGRTGGDLRRDAAAADPAGVQPARGADGEPEPDHAQGAALRPDVLDGRGGDRPERDRDLCRPAAPEARGERGRASARCAASAISSCGWIEAQGRVCASCAGGLSY